MRWTLVALAAVVAAVTGHALAADLPTPNLPPPLPPAVYNWTGFYLGLNGGFGTGNSNWSDGPIGTTGSFPTSGFLIGGTVGINYQLGEYVFGIEGDGDWTNLNGNSGSTCGAISAVLTPPVSCQTQSQFLFVDLPNATCTTVGNCGGAAGSIVSFNETIIRAGVNFKFGPW